MKKIKILILTTVFLSLCIVVAAFQVSASPWIPTFLYETNFNKESCTLKIVGDEYQFNEGAGIENFDFVDFYGLCPEELGGLPNTPWLGHGEKTKKVVLGDYLNRIGALAFYKFYNIKTMYIPKEITFIHEEAFYKANVPEKIYFGGTQQAWEEMTKDLEGFENCTVYYNVEPCTEHEFKDYVSNNDATYTADGTKYAICSKNEFCGQVNTVTDEGSKLILGNVKNLTVTPLKGKAEFKWDAVDGATGYGIFIKEKRNNTKAEWKIVKYTTELSFINTSVLKGSTREYAVRAFIIHDDKLLWAPDFETIWACALPESPEKVEYEFKHYQKSTISFDEEADGYALFKYDYAKKSWVKIDSELDTLDNLKYKCYFYVPNLKYGERYKFAVRAYCFLNHKRVWADTYTTVEILELRKIALRVASTAKGRATLAWENIDGETGYQIWYFKKGDTKYTKLGNFKADTIKTYATGLTSGTTYAFRVRAYAKVGNSYVYSAFSDAKAVKIK